MPDWAANLFSLLLGAGLTLFSGWISDRRSAARDREIRAEEKEENLRLRRSEFQRDTLLKLQDAAMRLARCASATHHQDVMAFRANGQWQRQLLSEQLSEDFRLAIAEVNLLTSRVRDEVIRTLAAEFRNLCAESARSQTEDSAAAAITRGMDKFEALIERSGKLIRDLDEMAKA